MNSQGKTDGLLLLEKGQENWQTILLGVRP